jgi:hypothetical protein
VEGVEASLIEDQMRDDEHRAAASAQIRRQIPEAQVRLPVEALIRLVEQQDARIVHERESEVELLRCATAERRNRRFTILPVGQTV